MINSSLSIDSLASNPRSSKFDFTHRQHQLAFLQRALDSTDPPPDDVYADSVPTSIAIAGPGSYGVKELDENGEDVILLNDDVLTSVANATVVVIDGNDLERITVLYQFPQFLEHCPQESINIMVPRICSEAVGWSTDAQLAACEALFYVVNVSVPYRIANHIACSALQITSDCADMHVFNACSELISTVLTQVHRYDVLQNVVPEAVDRAVSPAPHQRRLAARIIGALNDSLHAAELDAIFVKSALNLAADREESVRAMTAQSLASIGRKVPLRVSERWLWPRLHDLIVQDVVPVRAAALRALAHSAEAHREHNLTCPSFDTIMKPLFVAECDKAADVSALDLRVVSDDKYLMLEVFSETFGHFLCALAPLLTRDRLWGVALTALRLMVTCNGPTVRHWCAYNMPAVAMHVRDADRAAKLTGVIPSLASDSDIETRSTLAAGIHELTRCLRKGALRPDVIRAIGMLFMDDNAQVRMNALSHFSDLLILLSNPDDDDGESQPNNSSHSINGVNNSNATSQQQQSSASTPMTRMSDTNLDSLHSGGTIHVGDNVIIRYGGRMLANNGTDEAEMRQLVPMFSSLELMSFDSWRTQRLLAEEVEKSAHLIPQAMLCEHVAPLLFQMARESTFLVRKASMRSLIHVIRYVPDVRRRNHILKHFKSEWAKGRVYWTRLAFIDAAECAYRVFSLRLFTALFRDEILALRNDLVVNVRLRLLKLLRTVAPVWSRLTAFRDVVDHLCGDGDWQVSNEARELRVFLHQREQQLQQRRQEQQLQQQQRQQQQGLPVTITPPSGLELLDLTKEELQLDATKEQAELRFFKHHKTKKRGKKSGRHSSKLRASVNSNNPGDDNTNNAGMDGAATPGNDLSMTSRSRTQSGAFNTADELADLETKTSHGLLTLDEVDADANSSAGVGVHSGRIRTRSVIDSNGSTYGRLQQQQQQQQQLSAGMSMALEDMFGAGDAALPAGGVPNSSDSKSTARRRSRSSGGSVGASGANNQRLSGSASSSAAVALAVAASAGAAPGANNNNMVNGSGTATAGGAAGRKKKKHAHNGGGPDSAGLEQDGEEEHAQHRQRLQQRNSLGRTSRTSSNSAMASQSPSTANAKTRRRTSGRMADGDATTTPTAATASTMRGAAANSAVGSAAAASAAATSSGAQAQTPAQAKGGFWAMLCSCFGGGDVQRSERR